MDVRKLLEEVKRGDTSIEEAENAFKNLPYEDLGYAKLDLHRKLRSGFPETVFCQGKPDAYLADIFETLYRENGEVLGTRATCIPTQKKRYFSRRKCLSLYGAHSPIMRNINKF